MQIRVAERQCRRDNDNLRDEKASSRANKVREAEVARGECDSLRTNTLISSRKSLLSHDKTYSRENRTIDELKTAKNNSRK